MKHDKVELHQYILQMSATHMQKHPRNPTVRAPSHDYDVGLSPAISGLCWRFENGDQHRVILYKRGCRNETGSAKEKRKDTSMR
jgi:hypothetical protein